MRLLKVLPFEHAGGKLEFAEFVGSDIPPYAILSHTWGDGEVSYSDVITRQAVHRKAFQKLKFAADEASRQGYQYVWVDTCCIDKRSSAELQEAINSMFAWYRRAGVCFAYLSDVHLSPHVEEEWLNTMPWHNINNQGLGRISDMFLNSRWFKRGWTLQELLAPSKVEFYAENWTKMGIIAEHEIIDKVRSATQSSDYQIGTRGVLTGVVSRASGIESAILERRENLESASVATRMKWASSRTTTREEDIAYCLLGLFDVNMPLLYGEGKKAFLRLQEEIMKQSDDDSIFAWAKPESDTIEHDYHGLLAEHPSWFRGFTPSSSPFVMKKLSPYAMTNQGLNIDIHLRALNYGVHLGFLRCGYAVFLRQSADEEDNQFSRVFCWKMVQSERCQHDNCKTKRIFVRQRSPNCRWVNDGENTKQCRLMPSPGTMGGFKLVRAIVSVKLGYSELTARDGSFITNWNMLSHATISLERPMVLIIQHIAAGVQVAVMIWSIGGYFVGFDAHQINDMDDDPESVISEISQQHTAEEILASVEQRMKPSIPGTKIGIGRFYQGTVDIDTTSDPDRVSLRLAIEPRLHYAFTSRTMMLSVRVAI